MLVNSLDSMVWEVEIVDLNSTLTNCSQFAHYPLAIRGTVGGLVDHKIPMVCGGTAPENNLCYQYLKGAWTPGA